MNINIVCVGKLKEKYWRDACDEYIKRLGAYCNVAVTEIKESRLAGEGEKAEDAVKEAEGRGRSFPRRRWRRRWTHWP